MIVTEFRLLSEPVVTIPESLVMVPESGLARRVAILLIRRLPFRAFSEGKCLRDGSPWLNSKNCFD